MKAIFKNKFFLVSAAVVLVAAAAITSVLLIPKAEVAAQTQSPMPQEEKIPTTPADLDANEADPTPDPSADTQPEGAESEVVIPADKEPEAGKPITAKPGKVEDISKAPEPSPSPDVHIPESSSEPEEEKQSPTDDTASEDKTVSDENSPYYGVNDQPAPPNNIDDIPDFTVDDSPVDEYTQGGGNPGEGIKF